MIVTERLLLLLQLIASFFPVQRLFSSFRCHLLFIVLHSTFFSPRDGAENGGSRDGLRHHFPYVFDFNNAEVFFLATRSLSLTFLWGKKNKEGRKGRHRRYTVLSQDKKKEQKMIMRYGKSCGMSVRKRLSTFFTS